MRRLLLLALLPLALAACGETKVENEPSVVVTGAEEPADGRTPARGAGADIVVVTHGEASSKFWAIVRNGVESAARQMDATVAYRAPEVYSLERMVALIDEAVAEKPDGLVVSFPEEGLAPAIRRAVRAGIPTVTINSGSDAALGLGVLAHVGQAEDRAGLAAGRRLAQAGVRRALCVNQQVGNVGLDARCAGLAKAMRAVGGTSRVLGVDDKSEGTPRRIANALRAGRHDGVLAANAVTGTMSAEAAESLGGERDIRIGTFDLGPDVLAAVEQGKLLFAVDQQAYLQGYLPVVFLTQRARYGLFPQQGEVIATGPNFVTRENAAQAIELSARSIR